MTMADVVLWVDKQDITTITENEVIGHIESKCGKTKHSKRLCLFGVSRLAGNNQLAGNIAEHKRLISILKKRYWGKL